MTRLLRIAAIPLVAALALAASLGSASAQTPPPYTDVPKLPKSAAGARAQELIDLLNAGDIERARAYLSANCAPSLLAEAPLEAHLGAFQEFIADSQGFDFHSVRSYPDRPTTDADTVVIVRDRLTEAWRAIIVGVEATEPHKLNKLGFAPARTPSDVPPLTSLAVENFTPELSRFLERLAAADAFSGSVLVAKDGKVVFEKSYGLASRAFKASNRPDTKFNLGSMNKMFTAVAIAQLVEKGKLSYSDPLSKYLDDSWLPASIASKIRIEHLLTHSSGLGSYFNETWDRSSRALYRAVDDYKPLVRGETLAFEPGTNVAYSNTGFLLLGAVIEKVTGRSYFDYVRESITRPAGMTATESYEMDRDTENLAIGYAKEKGASGTVYRNNLYEHVVKGCPAGGGFSTVQDLLRFDQALRSGKLLGAQATQALFATHPEFHNPSYGYGFAVRTGLVGRVVGHSGGFTGISSNLDIYLDAGWTAAVMSNYSGGATPVANKIDELIVRIAGRPKP